ncbi:hypothetical protein LX32DRAFT_637748 [Colletotrichum zoysiae]|uniref:Uncharacterized protein n=1 Tax=Colletotrichum zoysiae TaxID=1216348 RepID=A0AAD9HL10_9PEZI|nr:hypothetical protein LX32DRAFT_637748 [Colletotrichum zoysiae]
MEAISQPPPCFFLLPALQGGGGGPLLLLRISTILPTREPNIRAIGGTWAEKRQTDSNFWGGWTGNVVRTYKSV